MASFFPFASCEREGRLFSTFHASVRWEGLDTALLYGPSYVASEWPHTAKTLVS